MKVDNVNTTIHCHDVPFVIKSNVYNVGRVFSELSESLMVFIEDGGY